MSRKSVSQESKSVYEPLIRGERDKIFYNIDDIDDIDEDDRIQPKCFAFKTEIKTTIKYIMKECPKIKF